MRATWTAAVTLAVVATPARTSAHDFWLTADDLNPPLHGGAALSLKVGDGFEATDDKPLDRSRTASFERWSVLGGVDLLPGAAEGSQPIAQVGFLREGGYLFGMERRPTTIELTPIKFNTYLRKEGLSKVLELRRRSGKLWQNGRERYSRYLKTLVQVGDTHDAIHARQLGHELEIIPQADPTTVVPGPAALLKLQLYFRGQPLGFRQLTAYVRRPNGSTHEVTFKSLEDGQANLPIFYAGRWLIRTVHMIECATECDGVDWDSYWASYLFEIE